MVKRYRINQKMNEECNFSSFDIMLNDESINDFLNMLEGEIKAYELIAHQKNDINNIKVNICKIKMTFKDNENNHITRYIKAFKKNIYLKKEYENEINDFLFKNAKCEFEQVKLKSIGIETT